MITAPKQVILHAPVSLRNFDFMTQPVIDGATAESYRGDDIADGGQTLNMMDLKVRRFVIAHSNLVVNPQFKTDTEWTKGTGWTINPGKPGIAVFSTGSSGGSLVNSATVTNGVDYVVIIKCSQYISGIFIPTLGAAQGNNITSVGVSVHEITSNGTLLYIDGPSSGGAEFEYMYVLDAAAYQFALALSSRQEIDSAVIDGHNMFDAYPASLSRSMKVYHNSVDNFSTVEMILPTEIRSGLFGKNQPLHRYNGIDAYSSVANDANLNFGANGDFSIVVEARFTTASANKLIIDKGTFGSANWSIFTNADGTITCRVNDGSSVNSVSTTAVNDGLRHLITYTVYRAGLQIVYIDAIAEDSDDVSAIGDLDNAKPFTIGVQSDSEATGFYEGDIFKVLIYNRALAPKEIEQMALGYPVPKPLIIGDNSSLNTIGDWVGFSGGVLNGVVGDWDGSAGVGIGKATLDIGGGQTAVILGGVVTALRRYNITAKVKLLSGDSIATRLGDASSAGPAGSYIEFTPTATETVFSGDIIGSTNSTAVMIGSPVSANGQVLLFTDVYLTDPDTLVTFPLVVDQWGKSGLVTGWTNADFNQFTSSGTDISLINYLANGQNCYSLISLNVKVGDVVRVFFDMGSSPGDISNLKFRTASNSDLTSNVNLNEALSSETSFAFSFTATANDLYCGFYYDGVSNGITNMSGFLMEVRGAVAAWLPEGVSKEQAKLLDSGDNRLNALGTNVEYINAPDSTNLGYMLIKFQEAITDLHWFLSINEDTDLPIALQKFGQMVFMKQFLFDITATKEYSGALDNSGVDVTQTVSGILDATRNYESGDEILIPIDFQGRTGWNKMQEFVDVVGGREIFFYMEVLPLDPLDQVIVYRMRLSNPKMPFRFVFGNDVPWRVVLAVKVDL